jgi:hypothetical protein
MNNKPSRCLIQFLDQVLLSSNSRYYVIRDWLGVCKFVKCMIVGFVTVVLVKAMLELMERN